MKRLYYLFTKVVILSLVMAVSLSSFGQTNNEKVKKNKKSNFNSYFFLQGELGAVNFKGDLYRYRFAWDMEYLNFNFYGGGGYQFLPWMKIYIKAGRGFMGGQNKGIIDETPGSPTYGQTVALQTVKKDDIGKRYIDYLDGNLNLGFGLINLFAGYNPDRHFEITLHGGVGHNEYKTWTEYRYRKDNNGDNKRYAVIGTAPDSTGNGISGRRTTLTIPVGLELTYKINPNVDIYADYSYTWMNNDDVDGVISTQVASKGENGKDLTPTTSGFLRDNDFYDNFNVGVRYNFVKTGTEKMAKNFDQVVITADQMYENGLLSKKGDSVYVRINGTFPPKYFEKNAVMNFTPVLKYEGGETPLPAKVFIGEDVNSDAGEKISNKNGGNFVYEAKIPYDDKMAVSSLDVAPVVYKYDGHIYADKDDALNKGANAVALKEVHVADGILATDELMKHNEVIAYVPHGYEKVTIVTTKSSIHFPKNLAKIDWNLPLNKKEENLEALKGNLEYAKKGWEIKDVVIDGWASPEGEETFNEGLSQRRAKAAKRYLDGKFKKAKLKVDEEKFVLNGNGPDWNGFMQLVEKSDLRDKNSILNVINSSDETAKEQEIRNMILIYPELERDILPQLRRAEIAVNTFEPKKSDEEIANLAVTSPKDLNIHELLYAATLTDDLDAKEKIYENAMAAYPDCWAAVVNDAAVLLQKGNVEKAFELLKKAKDMGKATDSWQFRNNMGVAQLRKGNAKHAEQCFMKAQELGGDEKYNLGLANIALGDYAKAVSLLSGSKCDFNYALAQVLNHDYEAADETLNCAPQDAMTLYLKAVNAARQNNKDKVLENLTKALKQDPSLKKKAKKDRSFFLFEKDADFKALLK